MVKILQHLKILKMWYLRYAEYHARNRTSLCCLLPWRKVYGHLAIKLIYWQNTDKQDQSWYSIFSMWSLGLNDSGHAPWHGFVKGFDVLGGDLSPDPSGDFFELFLKMTYQLQTSVISKRIELEQRDCAHIKDLLM